MSPCSIPEVVSPRSPDSAIRTPVSTAEALQVSRAAAMPDCLLPIADREPLL